MKNLFFPLKRVIFLSFILFTICAGEGSGCECENGSKSNSSSSNSSSGSQPGNLSKKQSSSSRGSIGANNNKNTRLLKTQASSGTPEVNLTQSRGRRYSDSSSSSQTSRYFPSFPRKRSNSLNEKQLHSQGSNELNSNSFSQTSRHFPNFPRKRSSSLNEEQLHTPITPKSQQKLTQQIVNPSPSRVAQDSIVTSTSAKKPQTQSTLRRELSSSTSKFNKFQNNQETKVPIIIITQAEPGGWNNKSLTPPTHAKKTSFGQSEQFLRVPERKKKSKKIQKTPTYLPVLTKDSSKSILFKISSDKVEKYKNLREKVSNWVNEKSTEEIKKNDFNFFKSVSIDLLIKAILDEMYMWRVGEKKDNKEINDHYRPLFEKMVRSNKILNEEKYQGILKHCEKSKSEPASSLIMEIMQLFVEISWYVNKKDKETKKEAWDRAEKQMKVLIGCIEKFVPQSIDENSEKTNESTLE